MRVGNGGFSLRSHRLLEALQDPRITLIEAEDTTIGRSFRPLLEGEYGIRFATEALADRFSFEAAYPIGKPFGFHGLFNFCRTVPPAEIAELAPQFSDAIARSVQLAQLARNCSALGILGRRRGDCPPHARGDARPRRGNGVARASRSQPGASADGGPQRTLSVRQRPQVQAVPRRDRRRPRGAAPVPAPAAPDALVAAALAAHQRGDLAVAERDYRAALAVAPEHPVAMHYLGVILYQRQQLDAALPLLAPCCATPCRRSRSSTTISGSRSLAPIATRRPSPRTAARWH